MAASSHQNPFNCIPGAPPIHTIIEPSSRTLIITPIYPYVKLDTNRHFRLLELFPESYVNPIFGMVVPNSEYYMFGTLSEHHLDEDVDFHCLSYAWGQDHSKQRNMLWIELMGEYLPVSISENLGHAIRSLQLPDKPRLVWIDFVCINQSNLEERKQQVEIMYEIFSKASKVVAYLGDESDGSDNVPELLDTIRAANCRFMKEFPERKTEAWTVEDLETLGLLSIKPEEWKQLEKFACRPWFRRVWIIQEALAAKSLDVICGRWRGSGEQLFNALTFAIGRRLPIGGYWDCPPDRHPQGAACGLQQLMLMVELGLCNIVKKLKCIRATPWPLIDILERSRPALSSDPRDRVYALLNISADQQQLAIRPDYNASVCDTFIKVAQTLTQAGYGPKVLCNACGLDTSLNLPSWVPNWSLSLDVLPFETLAGQTNYIIEDWNRSAGGSSHNIRLGVKATEMLVDAYVVGAIAGLSDIRHYEEEPVGYVDSESSKPEEPAPQTSGIGNSGAVTAEVERTEVTSSCEASPEDQERNAGTDGLSTYPPLFRLANDVMEWLRTSGRYGDEDYTEIIWRSLTCDQALDRRPRAPAGYGACFRAYYERTKLVYGSSHDDRLKKIMDIEQKILAGVADQIPSDEAILDMMKNYIELEKEMSWWFQRAAKRFCFQLRGAITGTGFVAMVPHATETGDVITVMKGIPVPMVLRPVSREEVSGNENTKPDRESALGNRFKVVGQAYVYGIMDGEVLEDSGYECETVVIV